MNDICENDLELLARAKDRFPIVHCPRSHQYFGRAPFQWAKFRECGFNLCLGTDSLASNSSLSLFAELRALQKSQPNLSPQAILETATINPARALRVSNELGRLQPGFVADLIAMPIKLPLKEAYEAIVAFENLVSWMMIAGKVISP